MSRNDWEKGDIVIPTAQWTGFKKALRDAYNRAQTQDFDLAQKLFEAVKLAKKGERNVDWAKAVEAEFDKVERASRYRYDQPKYEFKLSSFWDLRQILLVTEASTGKTKLRAPMKKSFAPATGKTMDFPAGDGRIFLIDAKRIVQWHVSENNHAVDNARGSYMGRALFELLAKVTWTRGSGGALIGNDEYNRDAAKEYAGGGGSYICSAYGPLGEKERDLVAGIRPRRPSKPKVSKAAHR